MKTALCMVLLLITNLAFSQTENQAGKWGLSFSGATDFFRHEHNLPMRWRYSLSGGKKIGKSIFLGAELSLNELQEKRLGTSFLNSGLPRPSDKYGSWTLGPRVLINIAGPVFLASSYAVGPAVHVKTINFPYPNEFSVKGSGWASSFSIGSGATMFSKRTSGNFQLMPSVQYQIDHFRIDNASGQVQKEEKIRRSFFLKVELAFFFRTGTT